LFKKERLLASESNLEVYPEAAFSDIILVGGFFILLLAFPLLTINKIRKASATPPRVPPTIPRVRTTFDTCFFFFVSGNIPTAKASV
jgi:uncharacterized membrane protein YqgA involved in biofilm formation